QSVRRSALPRRRRTNARSGSYGVPRRERHARGWRAIRPADGGRRERMSTVKTAELVAIDERRLLRRLDDLAQRGALPGGGIFRALYTPAWVAAAELVTGWLKEAGLLVRRDAVGNIWGRIEGARGGRAIVTVAHFDTVRNGGR